MTREDEKEAILREIGQKIQECRALVDKIDGGFTVRLQLDKLLEKVLKWGESARSEQS